MQTIQQAIDAASASARKVFGPDLKMMVARCPAWGGADTCIIINGALHAKAAQGFAQVIPGAKLTPHTSGGFLGLPASTYTVVEF